MPESYDIEELEDCFVCVARFVKSPEFASKINPKWQDEDSCGANQIDNLFILVEDVYTAIELFEAGFGPDEYNELVLAEQQGLDFEQIRRLIHIERTQVRSEADSGEDAIRVDCWKQERMREERLKMLSSVEGSAKSLDWLLEKKIDWLEHQCDCEDEEMK